METSTMERPESATAADAKARERWRKFGDWVRRERLAIVSKATGLPLTQREAADLADMTVGNWQRLEVGWPTKFTTIPRIARALGLTTEAEIAQVYRAAGWDSKAQEPALPLSMRHFLDLPLDQQEQIGKLVQTMHEANQSAIKTEKGRR